MASPVREGSACHHPTNPPCLSPAFQNTGLHRMNWLPASSTTHARRPSNAYIDPNPSALVWAMVFDVDRPEAATAWQDAPTECPRPNWVTPEPRNGHAHLGYVLASPVSRTLKARATPQRFLPHSVRPDHGPRCGQAYTHRLTKTPTIPPWRTFGSALTPTSWGSYVTTFGDRLPLYRTTGSGGGGEERHLFDGLQKWAYRARLGYSDWHLWERARALPR
jgi:hypothetical protein